MAVYRISWRLNVLRILIYIASSSSLINSYPLPSVPNMIKWTQTGRKGERHRRTDYADKRCRPARQSELAPMGNISNKRIADNVDIVRADENTSITKGTASVPSCALLQTWNTRHLMLHFCSGRCHRNHEAEENKRACAGRAAAWHLGTSTTSITAKTTFHTTPNDMIVRRPRHQSRR